MSNRVPLGPKLVSETRQYSFNFLSRLSAGETILTGTCSASVYSGNDPTPSNIIQGAASINGPIVNQLITGGALGTIYEIACRVTTSLGQVLSLLGYLAIVPSAADSSMGSTAFILLPGGGPVIMPGGGGLTP
jgi:hypothetical protein